MSSSAAVGTSHTPGGGRRLAILVLAVEGMLLASGLVHGYATYQESQAATARLQREQALSAAAVTQIFLKGIVQQVRWAMPSQATAVTPEMRRDELLRMLRQQPAIHELSYVDGSGRVVVGMSRLDLLWVPDPADYSATPIFREAKAHGVYYGPITLRNGSEPLWQTAVAEPGANGGVTLAWSGLKLIWDLVARVKVGQAGRAYIVDEKGQLVAHPDLNLIVSRADFSALPQVQAALAAPLRAGIDSGGLASGRDLTGLPVYSTAITLDPPGWILFVEQPQEEALAPVYATALRTGLLLIVGLAVALLATLALART